MTEQWDDRTRLLLGDLSCQRLADARVLVVGVGGVGGYAAESLARTGVGHLTLVDADNVAVTNLNRQLIATAPDIGKSKVELFARRFADINPDICVTPLQTFLSADNLEEILAPGFDFVIDAIDTVAPKVSLLLHCLRHRIPVISSMGAGGRLDPTRIGYFDISETREDGLARAVRQRLKAAGIRSGLKVVASTEAPRRYSVIQLSEQNKRSSYGTTMAVPAIFGLYLANYIILKLTDLWKP